MGVMKRITAATRQKTTGDWDLRMAFDFFVDRPGVMSRVEKKKLRVLSKTGAYGRQVIRNSIRPRKSERKASEVAGGPARIVIVDKQEFIVPVLGGRVLDAKTRRPARRSQAIKARHALYVLLRSEAVKGGVNLPPRRGPSDLLRKLTLFGVNPDTETVLIGPHIFATQPQLVGAKDVPDLLEFGGWEKIRGELVKYQPHPYIQPALDKTYEKMRQLTELEEL